VTTALIVVGFFGGMTKLYVVVEVSSLELATNVGHLQLAPERDQE
jgi:hypothetical protein